MAPARVTLLPQHRPLSEGWLTCSGISDRGCVLTQDEAAALVAALLCSGLRPESAFALLTAAQAIQTEGISGTLVVKVPRKSGAPVDVNFTTGSTHIGLDL